MDQKIKDQIDWFESLIWKMKDWNEEFWKI